MSFRLTRDVPRATWRLLYFYMGLIAPARCVTGRKNVSRGVKHTAASIGEIAPFFREYFKPGPGSLIHIRSLYTTGQGKERERERVRGHPRYTARASVHPRMNYRHYARRNGHEIASRTRSGPLRADPRTYYFRLSL